MNPPVQASGAARFWVLGGRWADDGRHLPWPRVYGPFLDYAAAQASAEDLNRAGGRQQHYQVVAKVDGTGG